MGVNASDNVLFSGARLALGNAGTYGFLLKLNNGGIRHRFRNNTVADRGFEFRGDTTLMLDGYIERATTYARARALAANFANWSITDWIMIFHTFDTATAGNNRLYVGNRYRPPAEPSAYDTGGQDAGSGTVASDAATASRLGNNSTLTIPLVADVAWYAEWNRVLTPKQISDQWQNPGLIPSDYQLNCWLGVKGGGVQVDHSGYDNHGVVTGATLTRGPFSTPVTDEDLDRVIIPSAPTTTPRRSLSLLGVG